MSLERQATYVQQNKKTLLSKYLAEMKQQDVYLGNFPKEIREKIVEFFSKNQKINIVFAEDLINEERQKFDSIIYCHNPEDATTGDDCIFQICFRILKIIMPESSYKNMCSEMTTRADSTESNEKKDQARFFQNSVTKSEVTTENIEKKLRN